jgi:hypothetical protein
MPSEKLNTTEQSEVAASPGMSMRGTLPPGVAASATAPDFFDVLAALDDSKIKLTVRASSFWDARCVVRVSDEINGFDAVETFAHLRDAAPWLIETIKRRYPRFQFATVLRARRSRMEPS